MILTLKFNLQTNRNRPKSNVKESKCVADHDSGPRQYTVAFPNGYNKPICSLFAI